MRHATSIHTARAASLCCIIASQTAIARTWALVIAAAVLYVPANYYPVLTVVQLGAGSPSTIIGGVEELVSSGMYPLAALVFFASIAVPMMKLIGLSIMLITTQTGRAGWLRDRTRLYHAVRWIGRWSMIDIFMEALLGALVKFGNVVTIEPGIGAMAFCGVCHPDHVRRGDVRSAPDVGRSSARKDIGRGCLKPVDIRGRRRSEVQQEGKMSTEDVVDIAGSPMQRRRRQFWRRVVIPIGGVVLVIAAILAIALYSERANRSGVLRLSDDLLTGLERRISQEVTAYLDPATRAARLARDMVARTTIADPRSALEAFAASALRQIPQIDAFYTGDGAGNFMMVQRGTTAARTSS